MTITPEEVAKLAAAATPGPWCNTVQSGEITDAKGYYIGRAMLAGTSVGRANAAFIAAAHDMAALIAKLVKEADAMTITPEEMENALEDMQSAIGGTYSAQLEAFTSLHSVCGDMAALIAELEAKLTQAVADRDREKAYADLAAINLDRAIAARRDALEARADRIEELEAKLQAADEFIAAQAADHASNNVRYAEMSAKLAKAMTALVEVQEFVKDLEPYAEQGHTLVPALQKACTVYAELTGETDE